MEIDQPRHPLEQLTTYELRDYRKSLEHALVALPEHAPVRAHLRDKLSVVLAEVEERARQTRA